MVKKSKMSYEEALEVEEFRRHCLKHCLQGTLIVYSRLWRTAAKAIKKHNKEMKNG